MTDLEKELLKSLRNLEHAYLEQSKAFHEVCKALEQERSSWSRKCDLLDQQNRTLHKQLSGLEGDVANLAARLEKLGA